MCGYDNLHFFSFNQKKKKWILVPLYQMNPKCLFYVNDISDDISKNMIIIIYGKIKVKRYHWI